MRLFGGVAKNTHTEESDLYEWNESIVDFNDLLSSSSGMKTLSADCILIQAIGEDFFKPPQSQPLR